MRDRMRVLGTLCLLLVLVFGMCLMASPDAVAKKPAPPPCNCPDPLVLPGGLVCELSDCGFDCVYTCPFPF